MEHPYQYESTDLHQPFYKPRPSLQCEVAKHEVGLHAARKHNQQISSSTRSSYNIAPECYLSPSLPSHNFQFVLHLTYVQKNKAFWSPKLTPHPSP